MLLGIFVIAKLDIVFVCLLVSDYEFLDSATFYEEDQSKFSYHDKSYVPLH